MKKFLGLLLILSFSLANMVEAKETQKRIRQSEHSRATFEQMLKSRNKITPSEKNKAIKQARRKGLLPGVAGEQMKKIKEEKEVMQ
jgi:hypothetical protein